MKTKKETNTSDSPVLGDAKKETIHNDGQALLQWGFRRGFPSNSIQMPEDVVDKILEWRDYFSIPACPKCGSDYIKTTRDKHICTRCGDHKTILKTH